jgi:hypothetical protein
LKDRIKIMAGFGGYIDTLNFGLTTFNPALSLSHGMQGQVFRGVARLNSTSFHHGEQNRYSKDHQHPISIDQIPVHVPPAVRDAKYTEYKHARLTSQGDQIRLLELLPATWPKSQDFIACRLVTRNLSEQPRYEALSYTWGTLAREIPIFVVPAPLPAGLMVYDALLVTPHG